MVPTPVLAVNSERWRRIVAYRNRTRLCVHRVTGDAGGRRSVGLWGMMNVDRDRRRCFQRTTSIHRRARRLRAILHADSPDTSRRTWTCIVH